MCRLEYTVQIRIDLTCSERLLYCSDQQLQITSNFSTKAHTKKEGGASAQLEKFLKIAKYSINFLKKNNKWESARVPPAALLLYTSRPLAHVHQSSLLIVNW